MPEEVNEQSQHLATQSGQAVGRPATKSLIATMADKYGIGTDQFFNVIQQTIMPGGATKEQTAAFLIVCNRYGFDPFLRQIYAFPSKGGGIVPVVSIDGWLDIMNSNIQYDGDEYQEHESEDGKLISATVTIYRKNISRPVIHTEYLVEAKRNTDPWNNMPHRMLKNRVYVQGIRRAFGVTGIMDPEEADQLREINVTSQSTEISRTTEAATGDLKDRISAGIQAVKDKKALKAAEKAKEVPPPTTPPVETKPAEPINVTPEPQSQAQAPQAQEEMLFDEGDPVLPDPRRDDLISDADRNDFLSLMKSAPGETSAKQIAIKQKLVSLGYTNTKEIKYRHYKDLVDWAKAGKF